MADFKENMDMLGDHGERSLLSAAVYTQPQHYGVDDATEIHASYSSGQIAFLNIAPRITSLMSILGCVWIVAEVWYHSNKRYYVYHKIISAMALYCIFVSAWYFVADWAWQGDAAACRTQGYFVQLSLAPLLYFAMLFLYYMLVISFSFPEQHLTSNKGMKLRFCRMVNWQQLFHILPFAVSVATASASLALDLFRPSSYTAWCWIDIPTLYGTDKDLDDDISLNRTPAFQWGLYLGPAWFAFGAMAVAFAIVIRGVQAQEKRMKKYVTASTIRRSVHGGMSSTSTPPTAVSSSGVSLMNATYNTRSESRSKHSETNGFNTPDVTADDNAIGASIANGIYSSRNKSIIAQFHAVMLRRNIAAKQYWEHRPRTRQVVVQCGCYVAAFFWSNIFLTVNQIYSWEHQGNPDTSNPYVLVILQAIYQPLLGFFIFLAYRRPFYMRMRREGLCRRKALITSMEWNQNPVDPPGQRRQTKRKKLTQEQKDQKRREKAEAKARKQRLREEQRPSRWRSEPIMRFSSIRGSSRLLRDSFLELLGKNGNNEVNFTREDGPLSTLEEDPSKFFDASPNALFGTNQDEDATERQENTDYTHSTSGTVDSFSKPGNDSISTLDTRRTSVLTKDSSSQKFEMQREGSMQFNDLSRESTGNEKGNNDASFSLEQLVGDEDESESKEDDDDGDDDDSIKEDESSQEDSEGGDEESQQRSEFHSSFGRRQMRGDFALIKQSSDRYKDLVFMDIIPEADGDIEERWRIIESKVKRYKKTKHDKHKYNMSVPVISERKFDPISLDGNPSHPATDNAQRRFVGERPNQRFAWAKNPLFKTSGRKQMDASPSKQSKQTAPGSLEDSGDVGKVLPHRTSSGGYFSKATSRKPDIKFWAKLEREKSRQATLQAISSRRIRSVQSAEREDLVKMVGSGLKVAKEDSQKLEENDHGDSQEEFAPSTSNPLLDAGVDLEDPVEFHINGASGSSGSSPQAVEKNLKYSRVWTKNVTTEGMRDKPPAYVKKRISSGEFSTRADSSEILESSNELTLRSNGSSIRTIKRSNRQGSTTERPQRHSNSSGISSGCISSEEVSLVSDGPMSDDDFLSGSGSDSDDSDGEEEIDGGEKKSSETKQQTFTRIMRASLEELQTVSERSMEGELGESSSSIQVNTSDLLLDSQTDLVMEETENTEHA